MTRGEIAPLLSQLSMTYTREQRVHKELEARIEGLTRELEERCREKLTLLERNAMVYYPPPHRASAHLYCYSPRPTYVTF
jgi:cell division septum initiation protein DivIVA